MVIRRDVGVSRRKKEYEQELIQENETRLEWSSWLTPETSGHISVDDSDEATYRVKHAEIMEAAPMGVKRKLFNVGDLACGPYRTRFTADGQHLLVGGSKGHLSLIDLAKFSPKFDRNVQEQIRDATFLHNHRLMAVSQKKSIFIYDDDGVQIHEVRDHSYSYVLDYLPKHMLLVATGETGQLVYRDVTNGNIVFSTRTKMGPCEAMRHNPFNGIVGCGFRRGAVQLWSPNHNQPLMELMAHAGKVTALQFFKETYLMTSGIDQCWKVYDLRMTRQAVAHPVYGMAVSSMDCNYDGSLVAVSNGPHTLVYKDLHVRASEDTSLNPRYLHLRMNGSIIKDVRFRPFEDQLLTGYEQGIKTWIVPGSGCPNIDYNVGNPFRTKAGIREREVKVLLDKLSPSTIVMDPTTVGSFSKESSPPVVHTRESLRVIRRKGDTHFKGRKKK